MAATSGDRYRDLEAMIRLDISTNNHVCLDYLRSIAEVESGAIEFGLHEGEVYETLIEGNRVTVTHEFLPDRVAEFDFAEFKEIMETYWKTVYGLRNAPHIVRERPELSEADTSSPAGRSTGRNHILTAAGSKASLPKVRRRQDRICGGTGGWRGNRRRSNVKDGSGDEHPY